MTNRNHFIRNFFIFLADKDYALLKYIEDDLSSIGATSDIDIAISKNNSALVLDFVKNQESVRTYNVYSSSFMKMVYISFKDNSFLELDLINNFIRKDICYLDIKELLRNQTNNHEQLKVPSLKYSFLYILLFYILNKANVEKKYQDFFNKLPKKEQNNITNFINQRFNLQFDNLEQLYTFDERFYVQIKKSVSQENNFISKVRNSISYLSDIFSNRKKSKIITFSGVDGAGKTTILREFSTLLNKKYRRNVIELRHRPSILPILSSIKHGKEEAERKTMEVLPRTGSNKSKLSSYIRFFYYLIDYILGQWVIFFKYSLHGDIIIYDRYYFDFICDSRRTNIDLNSRFVKFFYKFVFKADLNIFLYAPPDVILSRKQEMDEKSITSLTKKYNGLFSEYGQSNDNQYVSIKNINKDTTMQIIEDLYIKTSL